MLNVLREIIVADIRAQPIVVRRGRLLLGLEYSRRSPPELLALIIVYAAVRAPEPRGLSWAAEL